MKNILYKEGLAPSFMRSAMIIGGAMLGGQSAHHVWTTTPLTGLWAALGIAGTALGFAMVAYGFYCYKRADSVQSQANNSLANSTPAPTL